MIAAGPADWHATVSTAARCCWLEASWARAEPERGRYDEATLDGWLAAVSLARRRGVEPLVCLHAGALPDWVIARDGWLDPDTQAAWGCYVDRLARQLGDRMAWWVGLDRPLREAAVYGADARKAARALLDAQAQAFVLLKRAQAHGGKVARVGVAESFGSGGVRRRLSARALVRVLESGRVGPPFALTGELANGTAAVDYLVVRGTRAEAERWREGRAVVWAGEGEPELLSPAWNTGPSPRNGHRADRRGRVLDSAGGGG
jgi:hypothetical protein